MKQAIEAFDHYLHGKGLRMTPQRRLILEVFLKDKGHMASEELHDAVRRRDPGVGQATVYRTLKLLAESGLAKELRFGDGVTRYEPKYGQEHHDHLICERCKTTLEIVDQRIEDLQEELAARYGYTLTGHRLYLYGICPNCSRR